MYDIKSELKKLKKPLKDKFGITDIMLFGSYAKGKANENSDVDIVILNMERKNGLKIAEAQSFLSKQLSKNVDLGLYGSLRPFIKKRVKEEMVSV